VDHEIRAVDEGPVVDRAREGRIDHHLHAARVRHLDGLGQIDDAQVGVGRRLGEEDLGVVPERVGELLGVGRLDDRGLDAQLRQVVANELARAPIAVAGDDEVRVPGEERQEDGGRGAHSRGEQHRRLGPLELAELALDGPPRGVAVAAVLVALGLALLKGAQLRRVTKPEGRGLVDRRGDRMRGLVLALAGVHRARRISRAFSPLRHKSLVVLALSKIGCGSRRRSEGLASAGNRPAFSNPKNLE
jgi:hypothetical protein